MTKTREQVYQHNIRAAVHNTLIAGQEDFAKRLLEMLAGCWAETVKQNEGLVGEATLWELKRDRDIWAAAAASPEAHQLFTPGKAVKNVKTWAAKKVRDYLRDEGLKAGRNPHYKPLPEFKPDEFVHTILPVDPAEWSNPDAYECSCSEPKPCGHIKHAMAQATRAMSGARR
jgi:hypothetical protein